MATSAERLEDYQALRLSIRAELEAIRDWLRCHASLPGADQQLRNAYQALAALDAVEASWRSLYGAANIECGSIQVIRHALQVAQASLHDLERLHHLPAGHAGTAPDPTEHSGPA